MTVSTYWIRSPSCIPFRLAKNHSSSAWRESSLPQIDSVLGVIAEFGFDGIIATNTTLARPGPFAQVQEAGGLSGAPLRCRSTQIINYIARATEGRLPIIGVGGIMDAASAGEKLDAGATLVQIYTGMIYRGPFFAAHVARALAVRQRM